MLFGQAIERVLEWMKGEQFQIALPVLHEMLNQTPEDQVIHFLLGTCYLFMGNDGAAELHLKKSLALKPNYYEAMVNLASVYRNRGRWKEEEALWKEIISMGKLEPSALHNLAGLYLNNATPDIAVEWAKKSIEVEGPRPDNLIQLGLGYLEQEKWAEGFDSLDQALIAGERKLRNFWSLGQTPLWDGSPGMKVMIYGEQGHGDEIMFASCMKEAIARCAQVYIDTSKSELVPLYERTWPEAIVLSTPDSQVRDLHIDLPIEAACAFGSLPAIFRRSADQFPAHDGYLKASESKRLLMRRKLDELGPRMKIGIAWKGGVLKTQSFLRTINLDLWYPLLNQNADFISVNYTPDAGAECDIQQDLTGIPIHHWNGVVHDFDMLTALISELDLVISVPQTAVHQRAALGKECWILCHHKAPWPFGLTRDSMIWYPKQTRIFRMEADEDDWKPTILRAAHALSGRTGSKVAGHLNAEEPPELEIMAVDTGRRMDVEPADLA